MKCYSYQPLSSFICQTGFNSGAKNAADTSGYISHDKGMGMGMGMAGIELLWRINNLKILLSIKITNYRLAR